MTKHWWLIVLLVGPAATSHVRAERGAGGSLDMSLRGGTESDLENGEDRVYATNATVDLRGFYGMRSAVAAEFGFEIGAEAPGGFPYAVRLAPLGGAIRFGDRGWLGVVGGFGTSGVIDRVPIGLELPVTTFAAFDVGDWDSRFGTRSRGLDSDNESASRGQSVAELRR